MEKQGRPTATVITTAFATAARVRAGILRMGELPIVAMQHPLASRSQAEVTAIAEAIVGDIVRGLTGRGA